MGRGPLPHLRRRSQVVWRGWLRAVGRSHPLEAIPAKRAAKELGIPLVPGSALNDRDSVRARVLTRMATPSPTNTSERARTEPCSRINEILDWNTPQPTVQVSPAPAPSIEAMAAGHAAVEVAGD